MRKAPINRFYLLTLFSLIIAIVLLSAIIPIRAQGGAFATNTPSGSRSQDVNTPLPMSFATNTPEPPQPDMSSEVMLPTGPQALLFNYGLRFWLEDAFIDLVLEQIELINSDQNDAQQAVNLLLYELDTRFPGAPTDPVRRAELIRALVNAPVGTIDMREIIHPFIQDAINDNPAAGLITTNGFTINLIPANLDGSGDIDRVVNIAYSRDDQLIYNEYLLATASASGFTLLPNTYDLPPAPFGDINSISIEAIRDVNKDTLDEVVLRVDDGQASDRFLIIEHRNGRAIDLVEPGLTLRVGDIVNWSLDAESRLPAELVVLEYRTESAYPDWDCRSQIEYTWRYERNLYRRSQDLNARFTEIDSLGCTLRNADLFAMPVNEAIAAVESALLEYGLEAESNNRALMTLAMLYVLAGRLDDARTTAQSIITIGDDTTWESRQAGALLRASNSAGNTAIDICQALATASEAPACDMRSVVGRLLTNLELDTDDDLISQLQARGLPVLESAVVSEIGRADRTVVLFELVDTGWWGFYAGRDGQYVAEPATVPAGFELVSAPEPAVDAPQSVYDALLVENNPARVLNLLENMTMTNPDAALSPSALYVKALAYEFSGDRENARATYYDIWDTFAGTIWGTIASEHLELR